MNPGFPTTLEDLAGVVTNVRLTPATVVGGFAENKTVNDGYLVFFDKPAAEVTSGQPSQPITYVSLPSPRLICVRPVKGLFSATRFLLLLSMMFSEQRHAPSMSALSFSKEPS